MTTSVVRPGELVFAAVHLDHSHIGGMTQGLIESGATLAWIYDPDPAKVASFAGRFPQARVARSAQEVLDDPRVDLVAAAAVTSQRADLGIRVMEAGKDYFTDKAPLTTLDQLAAVRDAIQRTGRKYAVYYSERVHVEAAVLAGKLIEDGAIGRVLHFTGMGPHRLGPPSSRPAWFYERERFGGILCDLGSHNVEQMLFYCGATDAEILSATIANHAHTMHPTFEDFGEAHIAMNNGATGYMRVDWFTPTGLRTWGDGRAFLIGTEGYIELRKYTNVASDNTPDHVFLVNDDGEQHIHATGRTGFPFFGDLIVDCLERTESAMTQEHALKAAELSVIAQNRAMRLASR